MKLKTCVLPSGEFAYGIHRPTYPIENLRKNSYRSVLGSADDGSEVDNHLNFPQGTLTESAADWIFEIPNPFPFRGTTYIARRWAESKVENLKSISLPSPQNVSLFDNLQQTGVIPSDQIKAHADLIARLPEPLQLALASTSTDQRDLIPLARMCCDFDLDERTGHPTRLLYLKQPDGKKVPRINHHQLFEVLANNPHLPDPYKEVMVLRPGAQGNSEIVGEWKQEPASHIFEYLRRNSYIPWGHFAANMADDAVRYDIRDLSFSDMSGLRHLYYQRSLVRVAQTLNLDLTLKQETLSSTKLESIRLQILDALQDDTTRQNLTFDRTLWGWNFGFDYAPSHYRLHASHQQIHQQYALIPRTIQSGNDDNEPASTGGNFTPFACGDLIEEFIVAYKEQTGHGFFESYIKALGNNQRIDGRVDHPRNLIIYNQDDVIVFVPKAQTSQWELQLMPLKPVGNLLEADQKTRQAIDRAMFVAVNILAELGAKMITSFEYSKRINAVDIDQHLLYSFLPRLPESPGAFSEAQLRWINGHYPEDFAAVCISKLPKILKKIPCDGV